MGEATRVVSRDEFDREFVLESYGVRVRVRAAGQDLLETAETAARKALVDRLRLVEDVDADHEFGFSADRAGTLFLFQNGTEIASDLNWPRLIKFFDSLLRITVAEHAVGYVFIHAGVVSWNGKAIILPANSFRGKTSLVIELVKAGAEYYSDEYAVLDENGLVHPFPRELSVRFQRDGEICEESVPIARFGGKSGSKPVPVGMLLLTEFSEDGVWEPLKLSPGRGIMEVIPHTIPRNFNAEFSLKVLNTAVSDAIILRSPRGEAAGIASKVLSFFDSNS